MIAQDRGLVLRVIPLRETSVIASLLCRTHGKVRLVARGVRAPRSRAGSSLESGNEVEVVFDLRSGRDLGNLREAVLVRPWVGGLDRLEPMAVAWAAIEILERVLPDGAPEDGLLDASWCYFAALHSTSDRAGALLLFYAFELQLLERLGHFPALASCRICGNEPVGGGVIDPQDGSLACKDCGGSRRGLCLEPEVLRLLLQMQSTPWEVAMVATSPETRRQAGRVLHQLLSYHLEKYRGPLALGLLKKVDNEKDISGADSEVE